jgi:hypothetical protein
MRQMLATFAIFTLAVSALFSGACHPGPILNTEPNKAGGTIAGIVRATDGSMALTTRKITVVNTKSGEKFESTTGPNGGYTIKVPEGTYHIDVEVREGEVVSKKPDDTQINNGDLDSGRDFEITVRRAAR